MKRDGANRWEKYIYNDSFVNKTKRSLEEASEQDVWTVCLLASDSIVQQLILLNLNDYIFQPANVCSYIGQLNFCLPVVWYNSCQYNV